MGEVLHCAGVGRQHLEYAAGRHILQRAPSLQHRQRAFEPGGVHVLFGAAAISTPYPKLVTASMTSPTMTESPITHKHIAETERLIRPHIRRTPVVIAEAGDFGLSGTPLAFKLEFLQYTGSFKPRRRPARCWRSTWGGGGGGGGLLALDAGCRFTIDSDAHYLSEWDNVPVGHGPGTPWLARGAACGQHPAP